MLAVVYAFTPGALASGPMLVSLTESGVVAVQGGATTIILLENVASVRLWYDPSRFDSHRYRCRITSRKGPTIDLCSSSFEGPLQFKPQLAEYRAFLEALHRALIPQGAAVSFHAGRSRLAYGLNTGCVAVVFTALAAVLLMLGFQYLGVPSIVRLLVIVLAIPVLVQWIRRNRPMPYHPSAIPQSVLPDVAASVPLAAPAPLAVTAPSSASATSAAPAPPALQAEAPGDETRRYVPEDFGPIAEPGDPSWCSVGGNTTHWADAIKYAEQANQELDAGLIPPPSGPPPCPPWNSSAAAKKTPQPSQPERQPEPPRASGDDEDPDSRES